MASARPILCRTAALPSAIWPPPAPVVAFAAATAWPPSAALLQAPTVHGVGAAYDISTTDGPILGVAALSQTGPVSVASSAPLTSSSNPAFSFATPNGTPALGSDASNYLFAGLSGTFATSSTTSGAPAAGALLALNTSGSAPAVLFNHYGGRRYRRHPGVGALDQRQPAG